MAKFLDLFVLTILICAVALRVAWFLKDQKQAVLPKNTPIKFAFKIKREPKISYQNQIIEVAGERIITGLYPKYRVGEKLLVEGVADDLGRIYYPKVEVVGQEKGWGFYLFSMRQQISGNFQKLLPAKEATLVGGTVLGIDSIGQNFRDQLIKTGTIHVVVVSGQNLMLVAGMFLSLVKFLGRRKCLILSTVAVIFYAVLTGLEPPVLRASMMVLVSGGAIYLGREIWPVWNLVLAALVIIFIWPASVFEVSFQLTFAASLGIMTLGQGLVKISNFKFQISNLLWNNTAIAVSAYLFTAPVILFHFGKIWPLAPFANILVMGAVFPLMVLGFLVAFASLIFMPLAQLLAYLAYVSAFYFVKVVEEFAKLPVEQLSLGQGSLVVVISFYISIFGLMWIWGRNVKSKIKD